MGRKSKAVWLAGSKLDSPFHACAFVANKAEEDRILLPFMANGIELGEKCINVLASEDFSERLARLESVGIDVKLSQKTGQLELRPWEKAYLDAGKFDPLRLIARINQTAELVEQRYQLTRVWSKPDWSSSVFSDIDDLIEYEARFNNLWPRFNAAFVCVYDIRAIRAVDAFRILRTHPITIIGGAAAKNPHYVQPGEILRELQRPAQFA